MSDLAQRLALEFEAMRLAVTVLLERGERLSRAEALALASARIGRPETPAPLTDSQGNAEGAR